MASSDPPAGSAAGVDEDGLSYSPATGLIAASTIHTSAEGLDKRLTLVDAGDRAIQVYAAWPRDASSAPVMLVVSEAFGLHAHIADVVRRFAHWAPEPRRARVPALGVTTFASGSRPRVRR